MPSGTQFSAYDAFVLAIPVLLALQGAFLVLFPQAAIRTFSPLLRLPPWRPLVRLLGLVSVGAGILVFIDRT